MMNKLKCKNVSFESMSNEKNYNTRIKYHFKRESETDVTISSC